MSDQNKLHSVHFLRFIAALAVVAHHVLIRYEYPVSVGAAGVDVFFIISGLVIGISIPREPSAASFAVKRLIRVLPLYWIASVLFVAVAHFTWGFTPTGEQVWRSIMLFPNATNSWYPIYQAAWTLCYEMFFYLVATICMVIFKGRARLATFLIMIVVSIVPIQVPFAQPGVHYLSDLCLEFCAGLAISEIVLRKVEINRNSGVPLIAAALVTFSINHIANSASRPMSWGIPATMLILGALSFDTLGWLQGKWARLAGDLSYSLYLVHVTTIQAFDFVSKKTGFDVYQNPILALLIVVPSSILIALFIHLYVERPVLKILRKRFMSRNFASLKSTSHQSL
ncbi:putative acyltransferase [Burkholderia sp. Ch1-1]|nr:putative acyltransferase [Burkholderia sp. Ch1-1]